MIRDVLIIKSSNYQIDSLICTGTRIRTQIKGVGDPYASRCTMPAKKLKAIPRLSEQLLVNIVKITNYLIQSLKANS